MSRRKPCAHAHRSRREHRRQQEPERWIQRAGRDRRARQVV